MGAESVYQISLIAAYIAGMVALFAPCCISYLFPAYVGNVFKERKDVLFMTFIYSLGIFVVMMPVVLGAKALQNLFFNLHDQTYLFGGIFMLFVAVLSFIGIKLPMPHLAINQSGGQKNDVFSTFSLGIFAGITSACCAPVLIGVIALSSLSPTLLQSLGVGAFYVLGMVTPLYIASLFVHKKNILKNPILKKVVTTIKIGKTTYPIFVSNIIASIIFGTTGAIMLWLTSAGKLGMTVAEAQITKRINDVAFKASEIFNAIPGIDIIFAIIGLYLFYKFTKTAMNIKNNDQNIEAKYICPMHPDVTSDKPGKCHKCGGMDLVKVGQEKTMDHSHYDHSHMDHSSMMASPEAASDFLRRFFIVSFLLIPLFIFSHIGMNVLGYEDFVARPYVQLGIASVIFYFGLVFFEHARHEIMAKNYGMMTLVSIAVGSGFAFSVASTFLPALDAEFYIEITTLIWILLFGHYLEAKSSTAAGNALNEVAKLLPKDARVIEKGDEKKVNIEDLKEGDIVRVLDGEKMPADGEIIKGSSKFNESHVTGESKPVSKKKGDLVLAGAICIEGSVDVRLMKVGENSTIGQIKTLIAEAAKTKPSAQRLADVAAKWLTFSAIAVALITIITWLFLLNASIAFATTMAITVLVIACPHALGLAIPTVSTIATQIATKNGLFIKDMAKLEVAKAADYVVFDKTGTLTKANFVITEIRAIGETEKNLLKIAASIESHSSHVIAEAIVAHANNKKIKLKKVTNVKTIQGKGIEGKIGRTKYFIGKHKDASIAVLKNGKKIGEIIMSDEVKPESKTAISDLHEMNIKVAMLTGDSQTVADEVAEKLDIDTVFAEVKPDDKYKKIKELQSDSRHSRGGGNPIVIFVGDGVNDAPALTQADVGIAIGSGTDVAVESGDVVLMDSNPNDVVSFIKLSKNVHAKMIQNLWWALGYNIIAIPAAAGLFIPLGFRLTPAVGALLMSLSSVIVVINAFTLKKSGTN